MAYFSSVSFGCVIGCVILSAKSHSLANGFQVEGPRETRSGNSAARNSTRAPWLKCLLRPVVGQAHEGSFDSTERFASESFDFAQDDSSILIDGPANAIACELFSVAQNDDRGGNFDRVTHERHAKPRVPRRSG